MLWPFSNIVEKSWIADAGLRAGVAGASPLRGGPFDFRWLVGPSHGKRRFNGRIGANLLILALAAVGRSCARWRSERRHGAVQAHRERFRSASSCRRIQLSSALNELVGVRPGRARKRMSTSDSNVRFGPPGQFVRAWHSDGAGADSAAIERSASTSLRRAA